MDDEEYQKLATDTYDRVNGVAETLWLFSSRLLSDEVRGRGDTAHAARMRSAYTRLVSVAQQAVQAYTAADEIQDRRIEIQPHPFKPSGVFGPDRCGTCWYPLGQHAEAKHWEDEDEGCLRCSMAHDAGDTGFYDWGPGGGPPDHTCTPDRRAAGEADR